MHQTLEGRIVENLRGKILSGEIAPGERLQQDRIAKELGVSHIPVRGALRQLGAEGLVQIAPRRGAVVTPLSDLELREIVRLRAILESELLSLALPHIKPEDVEVAQQHINSLRKRQSSNSYASSNWDFHAALYRPANAPLTYTFVERLHLMGQRYLKLEEKFSDVNAQHQTLLDLIKARKNKQAIDYLRAHIMNLLERFSAAERANIGMPAAKKKRAS